MRAELHAAAIGLKIVWDLGFKKVHLQVDSLEAIDAIKAEIDDDERHNSIIMHIQDFGLVFRREIQIFPKSSIPQEFKCGVMYSSTRFQFLVFPWYRTHKNSIQL
ncbi:hypothetical protein LINPERPRIM_LOCUS25888 [Linum perenne]